MLVPKVSFNVGIKQLENPNLKSIPDEFDLSDTHIAFEILESVFVEEQATVFSSQINFLRELGFLIEIDDFGSGHASIIGLMQLVLSRFSSGLFRAMFAMKEIENGKEIHRRVSA
jgi:EAL domain-containing protein (putative c-di-GMP-specific phosphodiesterase class I)